MTIKRINAPAVFSPGTYSQVVQVSGETLLYLAGQVAWDADGKTVGVGDLQAQAHQAFKNVDSVLAAAGSNFSRVIKLTIYVVNYQPEQRQMVMDAASQFVDSQHLPASTLLGVQSLARPDLLIEVEAIAAL